MTVQFDSNTLASALTVLPPGAATESIPNSESTQQKIALPIIDWNAFHPNGSAKSIQDLLKSIAERMSAIVYLGNALPSGGVRQLFSSVSDTSADEAPSLDLKASIVEASFTSGKFLFASEQDKSSGVLSNFRLTEKYQSIIGFAVPDLRGALEPAVGVVICLRDAVPSDAEISKYLTQLRLELAKLVARLAIVS